MRARLAGGRDFAECLDLFGAVEIFGGAEARHLGAAQNMATSVSTSFVTSACS